MKKIMIPIGFLIALIIAIMVNFLHSSAERPTFMREVLPKQDGFASVGNGTTGGANATEKNLFKLHIKNNLALLLKIEKIRALKLCWFMAP